MTSDAPNPLPVRGLSPSAKLGIAAAVAAGVVGMAFVAVLVVGHLFFTPEKQVEKYAEALENGDADSLLALAKGAYSPEESALLTGGVLDGMTNRISDIEVHSIATYDDSASVAVTYSQGASASFLTIELEKSGSRLGVLDEWTIVDPDLPTLEVLAKGAASLEVNGQVVDLAGRDEVELPVFPGGYEVTPRSGSRFLTYETEWADVGVHSGVLGFDARATDGLRTEVARLGDAYLAGCLARNEAEPEGCPIRTFREGLEDVTWRLERSPTYMVDPGLDGGWRFSARAGSANVTGQEPGPGAGEPSEDYSDTAIIDFEGTVQVDGDTVVIDPDRF
jgi:hypothetical protein